MSEPKRNPPEPFWNHRVVHRTYTFATAGGWEEEESFEIHEAHYDADQGTADRPGSITIEGVTPYADTVEGLRWVLERMLLALDKPVLEYDSFHKDEP